MAQKIKPTLLRLGSLKNWDSRWFSNSKISVYLLQEDILIRKIINKRLKEAGIASIEIERVPGVCKIMIKALKPGLIIGRGGKGIEELTKNINKEVFAFRKNIDIGSSSSYKLSSSHRLFFGHKPSSGHNEQDNRHKTTVGINLSVLELSRNECSAQIIAQNIASDLEKRYKFRKTIKKYLSEMMAYKIVEGAKIEVAGRLDGAEIARREWLKAGNLPLTTLRANIDYGEITAFTIYGTLGVKVWIYKGKMFSEK